MKALALLFAFVFVAGSAFANEEATLVNHCSIEPSYVRCDRGGGGWDNGCEVTCTNKRAICVAATAWSTIDPDHSGPTRCEVFPSSCYCKKKK
jgi:hypothetical protein